MPSYNYIYLIFFQLSKSCLSQEYFWFILIMPTPRGSGIIVVPGFCQALPFLAGTKTTGQFFFKF